MIVSAVGIAAAFILALAFSVSWSISIVVGLVLVAVGMYLQGMLSKRNTFDYNTKIKEAFVKIVIDKGRRLEALIDKYHLS